MQRNALKLRKSSKNRHVQSAILSHAFGKTRLQTLSSVKSSIRLSSFLMLVD
jgi:hypothetical protein